MLSSCHKFFEAGVHDKLVERRCGENLPIKAEEHLPHIFTPLAESPPIDTGDDFITCTARSHMLIALRLKFLDTGDLVTGCAVITGDFRLDDDHWGDFIRDTKIWCLPESW